MFGLLGSKKSSPAWSDYIDPKSVRPKEKKAFDRAFKKSQEQVSNCDYSFEEQAAIEYMNRNQK